MGLKSELKMGRENEGEYMDRGLYNKKIICPVCSKEFEITKVKVNAIKVGSVDSDFCINYEGINPILYDVLVCENCGYSAQSERFDKIAYKESLLIRESISSKWVERSFSGERLPESALEAYKLALYNLHVRKAKSSEIAKLCIRIAWIYRFLGDSKELEFIEFARKNYLQAYEKESFPADKLDEYTCMYMIGELNRRVGNSEEAVKWFSRLIASQGARANKQLLERARNQYMLVKNPEEEIS